MSDEPLTNSSNAWWDAATAAQREERRARTEEIIARYRHPATLDPAIRDSNGMPVAIDPDLFRVVRNYEAGMAAAAAASGTYPTIQSQQSWDRQPQYLGRPHAPLGQLLSRLFNGVVQSVGMTYKSGGTKRLSLEIDVPNDMTYETLVANLQLVSLELGGKNNAVDTGRRKLLKLEDEAGSHGDDSQT